MSLKGKLIAEIEIKSDGDAFLEIFRYKPHHISEMSPDKVQGVDLHEGECGTVGSVNSWYYTHEGKSKVCKDVIEAIDEEKKSITFKVIDGDILTLYKHFTFILQVDTAGENNLVTWTLDFEKLNADTPYPFTLMEIHLDLTKDIEAHHLK